MNIYENLSNNHSSWSVLLVVYNLSQGLCMKRRYMILSMMIFDPQQLGNDIDVYLNLYYYIIDRYIMVLQFSTHSGGPRKRQGGAVAPPTFFIYFLFILYEFLFFYFLNYV